MNKLFTHVTRVIVNLSIGFSVLTMGISGPSFSGGRFAWAIGGGPIGQPAQAQGQTGTTGQQPNYQNVVNSQTCVASSLALNRAMIDPRDGGAFASPPPAGISPTFDSKFEYEMSRNTGSPEGTTSPPNQIITNSNANPSLDKKARSEFFEK